MQTVGNDLVGNQCDHIPVGLLKSHCCICAINATNEWVCASVCVWQCVCRVYVHMSLLIARWVCQKSNWRWQGDGFIGHFMRNENGNSMTNEQGRLLWLGGECTKAAGYLGESQRTHRIQNREQRREKNKQMRIQHPVIYFL